MGEANLIGFVLGGIGGALIGHLFAALFGIRRRDDPNMPNEMFAIVGGIIGAIVGGFFGIAIR